jgi:glucose/arabinose dehydrogenase
MRIRFMLLAGALAAALLALPAQGALPPGGTFIDDDGNVHEGNIEAIKAAGVTSGCSPLTGDLYCPGSPVTRAEMAAFLIRALSDTNLPPYQGTYPDVPAGQWYTAFVERLAQLGITSGRADGTYGPAASVSRAEMAAFLVRSLKLIAGSATGTFTDVPSDAWYAGFAEKLYELGITTGCSTSPRRYCPNDAVTRDQMASFLARAFRLTAEIPPPRPSAATVRLAKTVVASGLEQPVFLTAPAGDTRLFIVDQPGVIRVVADGALQPTPFLDISGKVLFAGEQGLLGMAFHPNYATNGRLFVDYTNNGGDTVIAEYHASSNAADPASAKVLLTIDDPAANHNGGMLAFGPDGYLYVANGDGGGGGDAFNNGQNTSSLFAKLLRLDVDSASPYGIPATNPWSSGGGAPEGFVYGLRNPWRFSFDGHRIYIGDVGQNAWEEIDVITTADAGANLGWPVLEGAHCYKPSRGCNGAGKVFPVAEYGHGDGCSVTGGYVYRGATFPELAGHYFYGDFCSGWVRSFRYGGSLGALDSKDWTASLGTIGGLTSFGVDSSGELYVMSTGGTVWKIVRG